MAVTQNIRRRFRPRIRERVVEVDYAAERPITVNEAAWRSITVDERTLLVSGMVAMFAAFVVALLFGSLMAGELSFLAIAGILMLLAPAHARRSKVIYADPEFFYGARRAARSLRLFCGFAVVMMAFCVFHILYTIIFV